MKKSAYRRMQQTMRVKKKRIHDTASSMIPWFESSVEDIGSRNVFFFAQGRKRGE